VWVWAEDHVGATRFTWQAVDCVGAIDNVRVNLGLSWS